MVFGGLFYSCFTVVLGILGASTVFLQCLCSWFSVI